MLEAVNEPGSATADSVRDLHLAAFRCMVRARLLDDKFAALYRAGKIHGGVFLRPGPGGLERGAGRLADQRRVCPSDP